MGAKTKKKTRQNVNQLTVDKTYVAAFQDRISI